MVRKKQDRKGEERLLTEAELELMRILWRLGRGTVKEVMDAHPRGRELAYTTVSTLLRILEQKRVLKSEKEGRGHVYIPLVHKEDYESVSLSHLVSNVFDGTPSTLVKRLLESDQVSAEELRAIRELLDRQGRA